MWRDLSGKRHSGNAPMFYQRVLAYQRDGMSQLGAAVRVYREYRERETYPRGLVDSDVPILWRGLGLSGSPPAGWPGNVLPPPSTGPAPESSSLESSRLSGT